MSSRLSEPQATAFIDFLFINISNQFLNPLVSPKSWDNNLLQLYNVLCEVSLFACFESATYSYNFIPSRSCIKKTMNSVPCSNIYATCDFIHFYHLLQNLGKWEVCRVFSNKQASKLEGGRQKNTTAADFIWTFHPQIRISLQLFILKKKLHSFLTPHTVNLL